MLKLTKRELEDLRYIAQRMLREYEQEKRGKNYMRLVLQEYEPIELTTHRDKRVCRHVKIKINDVIVRSFIEGMSPDYVIGGEFDDLLNDQLFLYEKALNIETTFIPYDNNTGN